MKSKKQKHVHFIGICGVAMAPLAVLYKKMGWRVTGSDRAFFPPMSTYLKRNGIAIMPGFKEEHLKDRPASAHQGELRRGKPFNALQRPSTRLRASGSGQAAQGKPDLVVVMAFVTKKNPELALAIRKKIPYKTYGEVLPDLIEKKNSVVVAGSRGKTSVTALIAWVLDTAGKKPSFMIGGVPKNFKDGIRATNSDWSVMEGDEYPLSQWKKQSRFLSYHPRYLVLTSATWDHMDIFPTEKLYLASFEKLVKKMPREGIIIANAEDKNLKKILRGAKTAVRWYGEKDMGALRAPFAGSAWRENAAAAKVLAEIIGIKQSAVARAFKTFKGIARRQEVRYENASVVVIDDNAHTPEKVAGAMETLHAQFPKRKIIAIYEPGNRSGAALKQKGYATCFAKAHTVLLPRVSAAHEEAREWNEKLAQKLRKKYPRVLYIPDDEKLLDMIQKVIGKGDERWAVVFMSQKGFRGMIEGLVKRLKDRTYGFLVGRKP